MPKAMKMVEVTGYVTLTELGKRLGMTNSALQGRLRRGTFPEPTHVVPPGRRRYYTEEEVGLIMMAYGNKEAK